MGDPTKGIIHKFKVSRTDGSSRAGRKHDGCTYFVLDLDHDQFALPALKAYAKACAKQYPVLAKELKDIAGAHFPALAMERQIADTIPRGR